MMTPLSTLLACLDDYKKQPLDPGVSYDKHMLAAFLIVEGFARMKAEGLPAPSILLAATVVIESWLEQDNTRWATTYFDGTNYITELMNGDKTLEAIGQSPTMSESVIQAAEDIDL